MPAIPFHSTLRYLSSAAFLLWQLPAAALDLNWSAFGTASYNRSNSSYDYDRVVNNQGTYRYGSLIGGQLVANVDAQWSLTLQGRVAPVAGDSNQWDPSLAWSFISYRPSNDWLFRVGKLRMPMYLFSEIMDVGSSYDVAHMPVEVYSTAPSNDYTGASVSKTWLIGEAEWTLEFYGGKTKLNAASPNGSAFRSPDLSTRTRGAVLSLHQQENVFQVGMQQAFVSFNGRTNFGTGQPGQGNGNGPGNGGFNGGSAGLFNREIDTRILLLGADIQLPTNFRLVSEYAKRAAVGVNSPQDSQAAYVTLLNKRGALTPYVSVARLLTDRSARTTSNNAARYPIYSDQTSFALGTSYNLSTMSKLKAEWMQINISSRSLLLNVPFRERNNEKNRLHVMNLSYSASF